MRYFCFILCFLVANKKILYAQNYSVKSYQKINEIQGSFTGILDSDDNFGVSIDNIGDLDGNGVNDLAVGAFGDDDGGSNRGAVWILFLDASDNVISYTKISDTSGGFNGVLDNDDVFGGAVAYLGDLNNDGLIELAVGADYDGDGGFWHGAVWILSLNSNGTVNSHVKISDTQGNFTGFINGDAIFGTDIENIGDLNGDGISDLAVGSRRDNDGGGNEGALWILFLNSDLTVNSYQKISETQGGFNTSLDFEDYFGGSVANVGDLNGDGVVDLVVGCYRDDDQLTNSGSFYVLFLNSDGTVKSHQKVSNLSGGLNTIISQESLFGESIDGVTDIDGDGKIEIVVGAMKQNNPTLSVSTGAFFIIELNSDGTVSEEHLYTFGENCFSGQLMSGDLFGGSVCFLSTSTNSVKVAVGGYRDSENGYRKGAAWILNLGEISFNLKSFADPTVCGSQDGSITFSGLSATTEYTVSYDDGSQHSVTETSSSTGELVLTGLGEGIYGNIVVTETATGCTDSLGQVELVSPGLTAGIAFADPTVCGSQDGSITFSGLSTTTEYTVSYDDGSQHLVTEMSSSTGELVLTGLGEGIYDNIVVTETATGCTDSLGQVELVSPSLTAGIAFADPTACGSQDGSITFSGLSATTEYKVSYDDGSQHSVTETSSSTGELVLTGLGEGIYGNIVVTETATGCTSSFSFIELECFNSNDKKCFKTKSYFTPNGDGYNDFWNLEIISSECNYVLYIFDRYGKLLKTLTPENNKWNGTFKGFKMPSDDYWYLIKYNNGLNDFRYKSHFALKR